MTRRTLSPADEQLVADVAELLVVAEPEPLVRVIEPGVYELDEESYFADPVPGGSLSASGAKLLLPPSCPAKFAYARTHPAAPKRHFDLGHAAHALVLGVGKPLVKVTGSGKNPNDWVTNDTKAEVKAVRDAGGVPLRPADYDTVHAMAKALGDNTDACRLFEHGQPEQSLVARVLSAFDGPYVWGRGRLDWLPDTPVSGRMIVADFKTTDKTNGASPTVFAKTAADLGYYRQKAWYLRLLAALGISNDAAFVFVVQETEPPYLVSIIELDQEALLIGDAEMSQALDIYAECTATGRWPGYTDDEVAIVSLPRWKTYQYQETL